MSRRYRAELDVSGTTIEDSDSSIRNDYGFGQSSNHSSRFEHQYNGYLSSDYNMIETDNIHIANSYPPDGRGEIGNRDYVGDRDRHEQHKRKV